MTGPLPPRLELPPVVRDAYKLRLFARTDAGRAQLLGMIEHLEQVAAIEEHNLTEGREGIRLMREALGDLSA